LILLIERKGLIMNKLLKVALLGLLLTVGITACKKAEETPAAAPEATAPAAVEAAPSAAVSATEAVPEAAAAAKEEAVDAVQAAKDAAAAEAAK
jgi:hypothetical protein